MRYWKLRQKQIRKGFRLTRCYECHDTDNGIAYCEDGPEDCNRLAVANVICGVHVGRVDVFDLRSHFLQQLLLQQRWTLAPLITDFSYCLYEWFLADAAPEDFPEVRGNSNNSHVGLCSE